jgi:DNA replication protein DnaC
MATQLLLESYLKQLRLPSFARSYQSLAQEAVRQNLSYERYLLSLAREEVERREQNSINRLIRQAHFGVIKELADFDFASVPAVPQTRILELAQGGYIERAEPIILVGNPGLGKTHIATGLAVTACRQAKRVRFYNAAGLVSELLAAQQDYRLSRVMAQALKYQLIVLDELGFIPFTPAGAQLLFQFCAALYERVAVIVTTNLSFGQWSSLMGGDERMSAALLDRLTHRAHIVEFVGTSYRFREQLGRERENGMEQEPEISNLGANEAQGKTENPGETQTAQNLVADLETQTDKQS